MKCLITGGCGFLGSNLASEVLKKDDELVIFDNLYRYGSYKNLQWLKKKRKFEFFHGDIRNWNDVVKAVKSSKADLIFHLAGQVAMTTSLRNPRMDFEINALGSHNLLESVRKFSPESTVIYSSTNKVYGDLEYLTYKETKTRYFAADYPNGFDEKLRLDFHSPYGCSKGASDQYMLDYARIFQLKTVVFRHSSMFGGRQFASFDQGWVGWFCQKAIEAKRGSLEEFTISGNGKQVRDILHAADVVRIYLKAAERIDEIKGEAFNIGGEMKNSLSLLELIKILEDEINVELLSKCIKLPWRKSDQKVFVADISKARKKIGWQPSINKNLGINMMLEWLMEKQRF